MSALDAATVAHVARLARLQLDAEQLAQMGRDLQRILDYVAELQAVDTQGVAPMQLPGDRTMPLRPDVVQPGLPVAAALANAPLHDGAVFLVPRIVVHRA